MTATNHALTGTAIGLVIGKPLLAISLALLSHFICDALPHFGFPGAVENKNRTIRSSLFRNYLIAEATICALIVLSLALIQPLHWQLAAVCAFVAASPDLLSINRYVTTVRKKKWKPGLYARFATGIQWFERPSGAIVEIAWLIAVIFVIVPFIR